MAGHDNVEYRAFTQVNDTLSTGLRAALPSVAETAHSKGLIHENTLRDALNIYTSEAERTRKFLTVLRDRLTFDPHAFRAFVEILDGDISTKVLAEKMEESLKQVIKQRQLAATKKKPWQREEIVMTDPPYAVQSRPAAVPRYPPDLDTMSTPHRPSRPDISSQHHSQYYPANKPVDLPLTQRPNNWSSHGRYSYGTTGSSYENRGNFFNTPGNEKVRYIGAHAAGPQSEPALKHDSSGSMAFAFPAGHSANDADGIVSTTRSASSPAGSTLHKTSNDFISEEPMKTFRKIQSGLQLTDPSGEPLPLFTSVPPHKEPLYHTAPADPQDSKSLEDLGNKLGRVNIDGESASPRSSTKKMLASESTALGTSHKLPPSSSPQTGAKSVAPGDRNPPGIDLKTTKEGTTGGPLPQDALEQQQCRQTELSGKELSDTKCWGTVSTLTLDELKNNPAGIKIATTAPTPIDTPPNPSAAPQSTEDNENGYSHWGDDGSTKEVESHLLEPGSSPHLNRRITQNPSLMSSSSIDSNDSGTCESGEIEPVQESKQYTDRHSPFVSSGGIMPGACATKTTERPKRQRCSRCTKLKKELLALKEQYGSLNRILMSEREQSTAQVNDLKEQVFRAEQAERQFRQYENDSERRHQHAAQTIQNLQRNLQLVEKEKRGLKMAHDSCMERYEMLRADYVRANSLQCPDIEYSDYPGGGGGGGQPPVQPNSMYNTHNSHWQHQNNFQTVQHNNMYQQ